MDKSGCLFPTYSPRHQLRGERVPPDCLPLSPRRTRRPLRSATGGVLHEPEDHGYVTGGLPRGDRRRRLTRWSLNHAKLHADLRALIKATTTADPPPPSH